MKYWIILLFSFLFAHANASCDPVKIELNSENSIELGFSISRTSLDDCNDCFAIEIDAPEFYEEIPLASITAWNYLDGELLSSSSTPVKNLANSIEFFGIFMKSSEYEYKVMFTFSGENTITGCDTYSFYYST